jgi:hypothetical protein
VITLYRPPLTRHLIRCRALTTYGDLLGERLYLAPTILVAHARFLRWIDLHRRNLVLLRPSTWWIDCDVVCRGWEIGEVDAGTEDHRYTDLRPEDSLIPF